MTSKFRVAGALAAPLLLAGCGMPIGFQIASLLADGVSVWTTDKTLTDHGLSAVTEKDCALWRGVEGKDICRDADGATTALADATAATAEEDANSEQDWGATAAAETENKNTARRETPKFPTEEPAPAAAAPSATKATVTTTPNVASAMDAKVTTVVLKTPQPVKSWAPVRAVPKPPAPPMVKTAVSVKPKPAVLTPDPKARPAQKIRRTYYVIASYHRASGAQRFSKRHSRLEPTVLEGTAKGRRVFRVAIGPVAREGRKTTKKFLKNRGFGDAWALTIKTPKIITEVAALR